MTASPASIAAYGLLGTSCCEACGRPKLSRLFALGVTGCAVCDEVITRHRCTERPPSEKMALGDRWRCRVCSSVWKVTEEEEACGECGQPVVRRCWCVTEDRRSSGPRQDPVPFTPFRDRLPRIDPLLEAERDRRKWIGELAEQWGLVLSGEDR